MVKFNIFTIFPEMIKDYFAYSILQKAIAKKLIEVNFVDFRKYALGKHQKVDDEPYGGGAGMLLKIEPLVYALRDYQEQSLTILLSPRGQTLNSQSISDLKTIILKQKIVNVNLICGRYEGIDYRITNYVDYEISIGDYVLTGGELPAAIIVDALTRQLPRVINNASLENESFVNDLIEYPQYTRPQNFEGHKVPDILLSGDHEKVAKWRLKKAKELTALKKQGSKKKQNF